MKIITVLLLATCVIIHVKALEYSITNSKSVNEISCDGYSRNVTLDYRRAMSNVVISTYKAVSELSGNDNVYAPFSIYLMLAAIAEGADLETRKNIYQYLSLPEDVCAREVYYRLASNRLFPGEDIAVASTRIFAFDETLTIDQSWRGFVTKHSLLDIVSLPIKSNPNLAAEEIRRLTGANLPNINMSGNSVLLDTMEFNGLWTTGFSEVERAPFYDLKGRQIGHVDLMRTRQIVRMGYSTTLQSKVLLLPFGADSRHLVMYALTDADVDVESAIGPISGTIIFEVLENTRESVIPLEVAIPQFSMTTVIDLRVVLEKLGLHNIWTDESATRSISDPAALPSSYLQRVTYTVNATSVKPAPNFPAVPVDAPTGLDPRVGRDFIVNRPYLMGVFDTEVYTCILASTYSVPTYPL